MVWRILGVEVVLTNILIFVLFWEPHQEIIILLPMSNFNDMEKVNIILCTKRLLLIERIVVEINIYYSY